MAIRDLMFSVAFEGNVTDLVKMDSAVDDVKDNVGTATKDIEGMEKATGDLGSSTDKNSSWMKDNWVAVSGGLLAVTGAAETLARKNAPLFESIDQVSRSTGISSDELDDLAYKMTNVTFPLEDVTELMQIASQQGLESAEDLEKFGNFWDTVGDATNLSGPALGKASTALRSVGIAAGEEEQALAAFGYVTESTTGNVEEFMTFLDKTGPQLRDLGLDINDSAAMLGILEKEFGMSGRTARQEFRKAVNESDGDLSTMLETLGVSEEMMSSYKNEVESASDVIQENADIHADSYTTTQKLGNMVGNLGFKFGRTAKKVSEFAPLITAVGPAMGMVGKAQDLLGSGMFKNLIPSLVGGATSMWGFTTALLANPITLVVAAVVGLGVAIWAFATDAGGVTTFVKEKFGAMGDWVKEKFASVKTWFTDKIDDFKTIGGDVISGFISGFTDKLKDLKDTVVNAASNVGGWFKKKLGIASPSKVMIEAGLDTGDGVSVGLQKSMPGIEQATDEMALGISRNVNPTTNISSGARKNVSYNPVINIEVKSSVNDDSISDLEKTIKRVLERERKSFFDNLSLQTV